MIFFSLKFAGSLAPREVLKPQAKLPEFSTLPDLANVNE